MVGLRKFTVARHTMQGLSEPRKAYIDPGQPFVYVTFSDLTQITLQLEKELRKHGIHDPQPD